jgi:DNA-binding protein HU-beta
MIKKEDFISALVDGGFKRSDAVNAPDIIISAVVNGLKNDDRKVKLFNVGILESYDKPGGERRNPKTGEPVIVPDKIAVKFKPSSELKKGLNPEPVEKKP